MTAHNCISPGTTAPTSREELLARAEHYINCNAAESGADVLIAELADALRAGVAQTGQQPVGWFYHNDYHGYQQVAKEFEGEEGQIPLYADVAQAQSSDRITQAIRDYCISLGSAAVQLSSDGVERIYYSGISIVGLADAISTNAAPANRSTAKATANVGDNGERMGSEPAMGIVTGGSDPTPSMMSSTDKALVETVTIPKAALDWLFGEGPDQNGLHFGADPEDFKPIAGKYERPFWWRSKFRKLYAR